MKILGLFFAIIAFHTASKATMTCSKGEGSYPYWVFNAETQTRIGTSGYSELRYCLKAVRSANSRFVCAPNSSGGSSVYESRNGLPIGFESAYFTSVDFCSQATLNASDGVICLFRSANEIVPVDYKHETKVLGQAYSSVEFCKYASASASEKDQLVCAMNSKGYTEIFDRVTDQWLDRAFRTSKACVEHLNRIRM